MSDSRGRMTALAALLALLFAGNAALAQAVVVHYQGPHPVDPRVSRAMCHIEGPHVHAYQPHKKVLYVKSGPRWVFVGDPAEYEPEAPDHVYYGHHPVFWAGAEIEPEELQDEEIYCYITGPHRHWYPPPPTLRFESKGRAHWYVGDHPRFYAKAHARHRHLDRYYARVRVVRPVVTVEPPEGFVGVYIGPGGRARVHGRLQAEVHGPGSTVEVDVPLVEAIFGLPGPPPPPGPLHRPGIRRRARRGGPFFVPGPRRPGPPVGPFWGPRPGPAPGPAGPPGPGWRRGKRGGGGPPPLAPRPRRRRRGR